MTLWVNMHPLREFKKEAAFLTIALRICDLGIGALRKESSNGTLSLLNTVRASLGEALAERTRSEHVTTLPITRYCLPAASW